MRRGFPVNNRRRFHFLEAVFSQKKRDIRIENIRYTQSTTGKTARSLEIYGEIFDSLVHCASLGHSTVSQRTSPCKLTTASLLSHSTLNLQKRYITTENNCFAIQHVCQHFWISWDMNRKNGPDDNKIKLINICKYSSRIIGSNRATRGFKWFRIPLKRPVATAEHASNQLGW